MREFTDNYGITYTVEKITACAMSIGDKTRQEAVLVTNVTDSGEIKEYVVFGYTYDEIQTIDEFNDMCANSSAWDSYYETLETVERKEYV